MAAKPLPSQEVLRQLLDYDPESGVITWKERHVSFFKDGMKTKEHACAAWNSKNSGKAAFCRAPTGYLAGRIFDSAYLAHRVIWKLVTGEEPIQVDHINGDRSDNRFSNLRSVDETQNKRNMRIPSHNSSGSVGISFDKVRNKWAAYITIEDRKRFIGRFGLKEEAIAARKAAEAEHGFHENHGRAA